LYPLIQHLHLKKRLSGPFDSNEMQMDEGDPAGPGQFPPPWWPLESTAQALVAFTWAPTIKAVPNVRATATPTEPSS
jgi:hypothetical protein